MWGMMKFKTAYLKDENKNKENSHLFWINEKILWCDKSLTSQWNNEKRLLFHKILCPIPLSSLETVFYSFSTFLLSLSITVYKSHAPKSNKRKRESNQFNLFQFKLKQALIGRWKSTFTAKKRDEKLLSS